MDLPQDLLESTRLERSHVRTGVHAVSPDQLDLAQRVVADALDQRLACGRVSAHDARRDFQVLLLCRFAGLEDPLAATRIRREGFLHEHMDAFFHRVLDVHRTERRVRGAQRHVARTQAVDGMTVGIEAQEATFGRHVDARGVLFAQGFVRGAQPVFEQIGHGHQPGRAVGRLQGIAGRAATAAAAADQGQPDRGILGSVHVRKGHSGQDGSRGDGARSIS